MKKALILSEKEENIGKEELKEFVDYAKNKNLMLRGEVHYPFTLPLLEPEALVTTVANINDIDEILVNSESLIVADILHHGKISERFHEEGIEIRHTGLNLELGEIYNQFINSSMKNELETAISQAVKEIVECANIAIITNDEEQEGLDEFIEQIMETKNANICLLCISDYVKEMEPLLEKSIKNCSQVIIFDNELANIDFIESMDKLSMKHKFDFEYKDNFEIKYDMSWLIN